MSMKRSQSISISYALSITAFIVASSVFVVFIQIIFTTTSILLSCIFRQDAPLPGQRPPSIGSVQSLESNTTLGEP
jgi:hypothetical protein